MGQGTAIVATGMSAVVPRLKSAAFGRWRGEFVPNDTNLWINVAGKPAPQEAVETAILYTTAIAIAGCGGNWCGSEVK